LYNKPVDIVDFEIQNCLEVGSYIERNKIQCEYRPVPACRTFWTERSWSRASKALNHLAKESPELSKRVTAISEKDDLAKSNVQPSCLGATLTQGAAGLWPYKYISWILTNLIKKGVLNLQTKTPVLRVEPISVLSSDSFSHQSSKPRYKIITSRGTIEAYNILLATNAYTSHLISSFADLIVPVRETMTALKPPSSQLERLPHTYGFIGLSRNENTGSSEYLIQRPFAAEYTQGHLMLGGGRISAATLPSVGQSDDSIIDKSVVRYLCEALPRSLLLGEKVPSSLTPVAAWTGIWAASRDGNPWVGAVPDYPPGLWLCAAYTGHGMPNATLCARAVVEMIGEENKGKGHVALSLNMVKNGKLPLGYIITKERIETAKGLPDVETQDSLGILGFKRVSAAEDLGYL
jgi:glycine/D-amino acid oxidase-like deaminating enzyme